ncbi:hypothetical protein HK102_004881 [Quaeritorhiza haematococci]|nr:hypothetical protein HK102_004881 [Quaeritorhiza haematococci]
MAATAFLTETEPRLAQYARIISGWNAHGRDNVSPLPHLERLEHRLFKLFFFDVFSALARLSEASRLQQELQDLKEGKGHICDLLKTSTFLMSSLLRLLQSDNRLDHGMGDDVCPSDFSCSTSALEKGIQQHVDVPVPLPEIQPSTSKAPALRRGLPPEIVTEIVKYRHALHDSKSLAAFALVNRVWRSVAMPRVWKNVLLYSTERKFRFLGSLYSSVFEATTRKLNSLPCASVVRLEVGAVDQHNLWHTIIENLYLFPNLRKLVIWLPSVDDLSLLFDQHLPALQSLSVSGERGGTFDDPWGEYGSWKYGPTVDRQQSRTFFSRLMEMDLSANQVSNQDVDCPALLDAAHANLRKIAFPSSVPDSVAKQFFDNCSHALSVVKIVRMDPPLSRSTFEVLAERCTGLRALHIFDAEEADVDGFEHLMNLRGPQMIALELGWVDGSMSVDPRMVRSIATHCRSLQYLSIRVDPTLTATPSLGTDIVDLIQRCGRSLQVFYLCIIEYDIAQPSNITENVLIQTIAECCPDLVGAKLYLSGDTEVIALGRYTEETLAKLVGRCGKLEAFDITDDLRLALFRNSQLRASIHALVNNHAKTRFRTENFFDWERYS